MHSHLISRHGVVTEKIREVVYVMLTCKAFGLYLDAGRLRMDGYNAQSRSDSFDVGEFSPACSPAANNHPKRITVCGWEIFSTFVQSVPLSTLQFFSRTVRKSMLR